MIICNCTIRATSIQLAREAELSAPQGFSGPLYEQVCDVIRGRINAGEWRTGLPIPGESDLSREFGVSVGTIRKALDRLVQERLLFRERGRGTFIKSGAFLETIPGGQICDCDGRPVPLKIRVLEAVSARAAPEEIKVLQINRQPPIVARVVRIRREWRHDAMLLCTETISVDDSRFPGLEREPILDSATLAAVYADKYRTQLDRTVWSISMMPSGDPQPALNDAPGARSPFRCTRLAYDAKDVPVEFGVLTLTLGHEIFRLST